MPVNLALAFCMLSNLRMFPVGSEDNRSIRVVTLIYSQWWYFEDWEGREVIAIDVSDGASDTF